MWKWEGFFIESSFIKVQFSNTTPPPSKLHFLKKHPINEQSTNLIFWNLQSKKLAHMKSFPVTSLKFSSSKIASHPINFFFVFLKLYSPVRLYQFTNVLYFFILDPVIFSFL